jgi:hypothetical protein
MNNHMSYQNVEQLGPRHFIIIKGEQGQQFRKR